MSSLTVTARRNTLRRGYSKFQYVRCDTRYRKSNSSLLISVCCVIVVVIAMVISSIVIRNTDTIQYQSNVEISHNIYDLAPLNSNVDIKKMALYYFGKGIISMNKTIHSVLTYKPTAKEIILSHMGDDRIVIEDNELIKYDLPSKYYNSIDFSSFQPYMAYTKVRNKSTPAYKINYSENAYTDENGFRRFRTTEDQFTINGEDDYIVALGTYYKEKGTAGQRYMVITTMGMYTIIAGDEKADKDTDTMNMFSYHKGGTCGAIIEWIVDDKCLHHDIRHEGTATEGPVRAIQGRIMYIYKIQ